MAIETRLLDLTVSAEGVAAGVNQAKSFLATLVGDLAKTNSAALETSVKVRDAGLSLGRAFSGIAKDLLPAADGLSKIARQVDAVNQAQVRGAAGSRQAADMVSRLTTSLSEAENGYVSLVQAAGQAEKSIVSSYKSGKVSADDFKSAIIATREAIYDQAVAVQRLSAQQAQATAALNASVQGYTALRDRMEPLGKSYRAIEGDASNLDALLKSGVISLKEHASGMAFLASEIDRVSGKTAELAAIEAARAQQNAQHSQYAFNQQLGVEKTPSKSANDSADVFKIALAKEDLATDWEALIVMEGMKEKERVAQTKAMAAANWEAQLITDAWGAAEAKAKLASDWEGLVAVEGFKEKERIAHTKAQVSANWEAQIALDAWGATEAKAKLASEWDAMLAIQSFKEKERVAQTKAMAAANWQAQLDMEAMDKPTNDAKALDSLRARIDPASAAIRRLEQDKKDLDAAFASGRIAGGKAEYDTLTGAIERNRRMIEASTVSHKGMTNAVGLTKAQMQALNPQINDVVSGLIMGQPPMMIFTQQIGQIVQALQAGGVELPAFSAGMVILGGAIATVGGAFVVSAIGAARFQGQMNDLARVSQLTAGAAGVTSSQLVSMADQVAAAGKLSSSSAREIATAFVSTGKIGGQVLVNLTKATKDYAAATGQDIDKASADLSAMFADPAKAAMEAQQKWGAFNDRQVQTIKNLQDQGRLEQAQAVLLDGLSPRIQNAADRVGGFAKAWDAVARSVSNAVDAMGRVGGAKTLEERLSDYERITQNGTRAQPRPVAGTRFTQAGSSTASQQQYAQDLFAFGQDQAAAAHNEAAAAIERQNAAVMAFARAVDPAINASTLFQNKQVDLAAAVKSGATSQSEATRLLGLYKAQLLDTMSPMQAFAAEAERQARALDAHAGVARQFEQRRQDELKRRGLKPGDALPQRVEDSLYDGVSTVDAAQARDRVRTLDETAEAQTRLNRAQVNGNPREIARATTALSIAQRRASGETITAAESQRLYGRAADQASSQIEAQLLQMGLQAEASERSAAAAGLGEAAMRRAGIESAVAAAEYKGLGLETRMFAEMQEAAARDQAHNDFAGQINLEVAANERLIKALGEGVAARRDAEIDNKAFAQTLREIPYPKAGESLDDWNARLDANVAKLKEQRDAADGVDLRKYITQLQDAKKGLEFQASTIGLSEDAKAIAKAEHDALEYSRQQFGEYAKLSAEKKKQTDEAVRAAKENAGLTTQIKRQEDAYQAVGQSIDNAVVRPLESVVDALVKGQAETLKWGDILKGVAASLAGDALKMGVINPAKNALGLGQNASLWDLPAFGGAQQQTVRNADGSVSMAPAAQGVGGSWLSQPVFGSQPSAAQMQGIDDVGQLGYSQSGIAGWNPTWGQVIQGVGGVAGGAMTATAKGATAGQKIGGGLMAAGGIAAMIPGGQIVGGVMMAAGALLSAVTGAKDRGTAYSRSNITLGGNGKYGLGTYAADNDGNPTQFNADAAKVAKGLNDIAAKLNLTPGKASSYIDTKSMTAEQAALELLKGMQSAVPEVSYALAHETSVSLEEALQHLEFANSVDKQIAGLRSSISDLFSQFQSGVDSANSFSKTLLDIVDNASTTFKVEAGATLPGFARGTLSAPSGWAVVGEEGPEIVNLQGGERIWTARESARMLAGMGQGRDDTLIHLRSSDELAAVRRALGTQGRINPATGLWAFENGGDSGGANGGNGESSGAGAGSSGSSGASASGQGGENSAHGETQSSTSSRDSNYGGGWGDSSSGGGIGGFFDALGRELDRARDALADFAGWTNTNSKSQTQNNAGMGMLGVVGTLGAVAVSATASAIGQGLTDAMSAITGEPGTAAAVGPAGDTAGNGSAESNARIAEVITKLQDVLASDPSGELLSGLVGRSRVGDQGTGGVSVAELAADPSKIFGFSVGDTTSALKELDDAARRFQESSGQIPDVLRRALDGANAYAVSLGVTPAITTRQVEQEQAQQRADTLQTQFDGVGLTKARLAELNGIVKSLGDNTFSPIGKDFDALAADMQRAATAYTAAGQQVPDGLFAAQKQMETLGAAKKRLLDEVAGVVVETSPEQKRVEQIKGQWSATATDLVAAFAKVGIAGDELSAKLGEGLANALKKEQTSYSKSADTTLRKAKGEEGYDTAVTAIDGYTTALSDINALWPVGADRAKETGKAVDTLGLNLTGLVKSGSITSKSLKELQTAYADQPAILAAVTAALGDLEAAATATAANNMADLTVRAMRATGNIDGADDYAQALADQREIADATAKGMDQAYIAGLRWVQGIEASTRATERAALVQERNAGLASRIYTLLGNTRAASYVEHQVKSDRELRDAQAQGWSASQIDTLKAVQYAESWQISANGAKQMLLTEIDRQAQALQANNTALQANNGHLLELRATLRDAADSTKLNKDLTILTPEEQLKEARRQFETALSTYNDTSQTDDARYAAGQKLSGLGQSLIGASKAWNPVDNTDWDHVMDVWTNIGGVSDDELAVAQKTLDANNKQISELQKLRDKYTSYGERQVAGIDTLIDATERSYAEFNRALDVLGGGTATSTPTTGGVVAPDKGGTSAAQQAGQWMTDWFGRYDAYTAKNNAGQLSQDEWQTQGAVLFQDKVNKANALPLEPAVWNSFIAAAANGSDDGRTAAWLRQVAHDKGVPGFATGTLATPPGAIWVGERGPELMWQRGGAAVASSADSMRIAGLWKSVANDRWSGANVTSFRRPSQPVVERRDDGWREVVAAVTGLSSKLDNVLSVLVVGGDRSHGDLITVADEVRGVVRAVSGGGYRR